MGAPIARVCVRQGLVRGIRDNGRDPNDAEVARLASVVVLNVEQAGTWNPLIRRGLEGYQIAAEPLYLASARTVVVTAVETVVVAATVVAVEAPQHAHPKWTIRLEKGVRG